jgi:hypothetical protein
MLGMIQPKFRTLLLEALRYFSDHGFTSATTLADYLLRLHRALEIELPTDAKTKADISGILGKVFDRELKTGIAKRVPSVSRYTIDRVAPALRAELDRRIFASVDLIKLNKAAATQKTLQRFSGWVTSVPAGGMAKPDIRDVAQEILKPSKQVRFEARRVAIDQGAKLSQNVAKVVSIHAGAIAGIWHDRGQYDKSYDYRPDHLERSGKFFLVRDSWAMNEGLIAKRGLQYMDEITEPAQEIYCSCWYRYISSLNDLPETLLTAKGREWLRSGSAPV